MKRRIVCLLLCILMLVPVSACSEGKEPDVEDSTVIEQTEAPTETETEAPKIPTAEISEPSLYLFENDKYTLGYTISETDGVPDGSKEDIVWTSSSDCVTVEGGIVRAKKEGFALVSAGGESVCVVHVLPDTMPVVTVDTGGVAVTSKEEYVQCLVTMETENESFCFEEASAGIRIRGNSTASRSKKPYRIKFNSARNLLGMNQGAECKSWVLLAERYDDSVIRNATALTFASMICEEYSSDFRYVTLMLNGENKGLYLLCEQSQINENRINIEEAGEDSDALRSGYLFEIDASTKPPDFYVEYGDYEIYNFLGNQYTMKANDSNMTALFYSIKNDGLSEEQKQYATEYMQQLFYIVYAATYLDTNYTINEYMQLIPTDRSAEEVLSELIDIDSLVRKYIHSEIFCNGDEHKKSYYMYVDFSETGTGKLTFSCPWDFDTAFVGWNSVNYRDPEVHYACTRNLWYVMMMNHEWFRQRVIEVWDELYARTDGYKNATALIYDITGIYAGEIKFDAKKWGRTEDQQEQAALTYNWLLTRIAWLNENIARLPAETE